MNRVVGLLIVGWLGGACRYRGAIYSSYQEAGLGIKMTAESNAPVKVHFGYDRGIGSWVPRRGGDSQHEEATSLIARDDVRAGANPTKLGTESLLEVDGALITGTAAIVASAPANATVTINEPKAPAALKMEGEEKRPITLQTQGEPGARIAAALVQAPRLTPDELAYRKLYQSTSKRPDKDKVFELAARKMSPEFRAVYQKLVTAESPAMAFTGAATEYLNVEDPAPRVHEMFGALQSANKEVH